MISAILISTSINESIRTLWDGIAICTFALAVVGWAAVLGG